MQVRLEGEKTCQRRKINCPCVWILLRGVMAITSAWTTQTTHVGYEVALGTKNNTPSIDVTRARDQRDEVARQLESQVPQTAPVRRGMWPHLRRPRLHGGQDGRCWLRVLGERQGLGPLALKSCWFLPLQYLA